MTHILLGVLIGFILGYYVRHWPRLYRYVRKQPMQVYPGRLTCVLYDYELLEEQSRVVMKADTYPLEMWRPHGRTLPTKYVFVRATTDHGIYREVK